MNDYSIGVDLTTTRPVSVKLDVGDNILIFGAIFAVASLFWGVGKVRK